MILLEKFKGTTRLSSKINQYDALQRRSKIVYTDDTNPNLNYTRKLIYDNEDIILELNENNQPVVFYLHGPGVDEPLVMFRDVDKDNNFELNEVFYFTKDHLNSIRELLDYKGDIYQRYSYTSYGETKLEKHLDPDSANFIENRYAYTSRELDKETGF